MAEVPIKLIDAPVFKRALATRDGEHGMFYRDDLPPGTAHIHTYDDGATVLNYVCPCGCAMAYQIAIYVEGQQAHGWKWNGNRERPTLSPSIAMVEGTCRWHGWLTDGVFRSALIDAG